MPCYPKIGTFAPRITDYAEDPRYPGFIRWWAGTMGWQPRFLIGEPQCICKHPEAHSQFGCFVDDSDLPLFMDVERSIRDMYAMQSEIIDLCPRVPWIGSVTPEEERRRAAKWAKAMGTGYPSPVESSGPVDQHHQNPSGEAKGQKIESCRAGNTQAGENEKNETEHQKE